MIESKDESGVFRIGGHSIVPGDKLRFDMPVALLPTHTQLHIPFTVFNGLEPGPHVWVSAALHGDELNGVEIIRKVLERLDRRLVKGVLIAVPIVNVFGFISRSRYLPDGRDLNRSFPGSLRGSLASRIAHLFMKEIVAVCTHGIDLHTGANERTNLPQIRGDLRGPETRRIAEAFGAPVLVHSALRDGSLRAACSKRNIPVVVYEGGEPLRFNDFAIEAGVDGVLRVLNELQMLDGVSVSPPPTHPRYVVKSQWIRARRGGLVRLKVDEGDMLESGQVVGTISDPFGEENIIVRAPHKGLVIGKSNNPIVHGGDAIVHIGEVSSSL